MQNKVYLDEIRKGMNTEAGEILHKVELFTDDTPNASVANTLIALITLTDVEFRMWLNACKNYPNFHPSHFQGQEAQFIKTGRWDWVSEDKK